MDFDKYKHYIIGENRLCFPDYEYILKLDFPRVYIKYKLSDAYFADFDEFYQSFAEVQWLDGNAPSKQQQEQIFTDAYNFLCLDERLLEDDLNDIDEDDF